MQTGEKGFFNDGKGSGPLPCRYTLSEEALYIYLNEINPELFIWKLPDVISCEQELSSVLFSNRDSSTLLGTGPVANQLASLVREGIRVKREKQGILSAQSITMILGICFGTILVAMLLYLYVLPWAAEKATVFVPVETEIALGEKLSEWFTAETETNDSVNYFLARFTDQLALDSVYPIRVKLIVSNEINAFALPGGNVFIYSALLEKTRSPEELVALLGHESTHISKRHSLKSMSRSMASGVLLSLLFGDASGLLSKADEFKQLDYSRELETEADINGLAIMVKNKVNPEGMISLLQILKSESENSPGYMHYLSTHPDAEARIESIKAEPNSRLSFDQDLNLRSSYEKIKSHLVR